MTFDGPGVIAHSAGEIPEAQPQTGPIKVVIEGSRHQWLELTNAGVLASRVAVVLPGCMSGADRSRCNRSQALIDHELAERSASASFPIRVVSALSLIHISEPTRLGMISYAVFCLK